MMYTCIVYNYVILYYFNKRMYVLSHVSHISLVNLIAATHKLCQFNDKVH